MPPPGSKDGAPMSIDANDKHEKHCRLLGHSVPFRYCRTVAEGLPCHHVLECWPGPFDVSAFVQGNYTEEEMRRFLAPAKSKLATIIDLIERTRRTGGPPKA
jgi:hypothetical protein